MNELSTGRREVILLESLAFTKNYSVNERENENIQVIKFEVRKFLFPG